MKISKKQLERIIREEIYKELEKEQINEIFGKFFKKNKNAGNKELNAMFASAYPPSDSKKAQSSYGIAPKDYQSLETMKNRLHRGIETRDDISDQIRDYMIQVKKNIEKFMVEIEEYKKKREKEEADRRQDVKVFLQNLKTLRDWYSKLEKFTVKPEERSVND